MKEYTLVVKLEADCLRLEIPQLQTSGLGGNLSEALDDLRFNLEENARIIGDMPEKWLSAEGLALKTALKTLLNPRRLDVEA